MKYSSDNLNPVYHPPHRWSGMPDRESYLDTPYTPSELEQRIWDTVKSIFTCCCSVGVITNLE